MPERTSVFSPRLCLTIGVRCTCHRCSFPVARTHARRAPSVQWPGHEGSRSGTARFLFWRGGGHAMAELAKPAHPNARDKSLGIEDQSCSMPMPSLRFHFRYLLRVSPLEGPTNPRLELMSRSDTPSGAWASEGGARVTVRRCLTLPLRADSG